MRAATRSASAPALSGIGNAITVGAVALSGISNVTTVVALALSGIGNVTTMVALALAGCWTGGADPVTAPTRAAPIAERPLTGVVLVWADARLYLEPSEAAPYVTLAQLPSHAAPLGAAAPMTVVSSTGAFVEVEPVEDQQCGWITFVPPSDLEHVRVFVRRDELSPVLAHPFAKQFVDGTRIALEPGVAVTHGVGGYRVAVAGDIVTLPIPDNTVGLAFRPPVERAGDPDAAPQYEVSDAPARLGPNHLRVGTALFTATVEARGNGTTLVSAHAPCRDFTLAVADGDVRSVSLGRGYGYSGHGRAASPAKMVDYLPAGTVLRSGDHAVGTTLFPIVLPALRTTPPCVDRQWTLSTDAELGPDIEPAPEASTTMHLCADPAAVVSGPLAVP